MKNEFETKPESKDETKVSAIIPTKNRTSELAIITHDLINQTLLPTEIVIIDQSSDDAGKRLITNLFETAPANVRDSVQLRYVLDPSISGGSAARNKGMEMAAGDIWLCLDDDMGLDRDFLEEIVAVFRERPDVTCVCGVITNYLPPPLPYRLWSRVFVRGPFHDERQPIYWNADRLRRSEPIRLHKLNGGAMAFRSRLIRSLRFDPNLTGLSLAEDVDLAARIEPGIIVMAPRARVQHNRSPRGRASDHWLRERSQAFHYLYRRNWHHRLSNRLRFLWLNIGFTLAAALCCIKQISFEPLAAFLEGVRRAHELAPSFGGFDVTPKRSTLPRNGAR
jgi:GT2 family glycosyltransferase